MKIQRIFVAMGLLVIVVSAGWTFWQQATVGESITASADKYLATLSDPQRAVSSMAYESPERIDWHFIPKSERKGLQIKEMSKVQRQAALALLRSCLSEVGYDKATKIMQLESVLAELEKDRASGPIRDPERYYYTVFGKPAPNSRWGLSIEGHHLSLNFVVENNEVISSTPTFFAAHPAIMKTTVLKSLPAGTRVLASEEQLAFDLLHSLSDQQIDQAVIAEQAPREIRAAGEPQPPATDAEGIALSDLDQQQRRLLRELVTVYADNLPSEVASARLEAIRESGPQNVHFAWAGADQPGIGHYYRIQGPTFLVEFVNTQPDAAGNPANHIHCVWRDMRGDFAIPLSQK